MALQHLRSSTANKRPVPGNMSEGQLAINTASGSPGLFFRDSNSNLVKVGPVHVGTTAPNASPASGGTAGNSVGEQWLDTSSSRYVFKIWDGSAWRSEAGEFVDVAGDVMTGALGIIAGSAGSPGLYFSGDTNTGIYSPGADQLAISTNGTHRLLIEADGDINIDSGGVFYDATNNRLAIGTTSPSNLLHLSAAGTSYLQIQNTTASNNLYVGNSGGSGIFELTGSNQFKFISNSSDRVVIDSSGRLLVGTSTARANFENSTVTTQAQVEGTGTTTSSLGLISNSGTPGGNGPFLYFARSKGSAVGSNDLVSADDHLGGIAFQGNDGSEFVLGATIRAEVDGTPGANDMPGRLVFSTSSDSSASPTERLRVTSDGYVRLSSSSPGIQFGGDTAAANALDDYEEGTFTPTIVGTSTAGTATYGANGQVGRYTKIGNRVFFDLYLSWTAHTGTGDLQINGLPFTVQNTTNLNRNYSAILNVVAMTAGNLGAAFSSPNTTAVALRQMPTGGGSVATIPMDTSAQISISGSFEA